MKSRNLAVVVLLAGCGGGSHFESAAVAEATAALDSAKIAVARAYASNNNIFPVTQNAPLATGRPDNARFVKSITYNSATATVASVVLAVTGTDNPNLDGKFFGIFGFGQIDGTVTWVCGTAAAATSTAPSAMQAMYSYLPAPCQH